MRHSHRSGRGIPGRHSDGCMKKPNEAYAQSEAYSQIEAYQERIERFLEEQFAQIPATVPRLLDAMRYSTLGGGKRLRPLLVYAAGRTVGADDRLLDFIAGALEMIHAYSLIHDDLPAMDDDDTRRGKPTCHRQFDEATAILAGDALQALAFSLLLQEAMPIPDAARLRVIRILAEATGLLGMAGGQALDLAAQHQTLSLPDLEQLHRMKTGALISAAILLPAEAVSAPPEQRAPLQAFADHIGLAFQVQDDLLDVEGDSTLRGKACGADQKLGKTTFPSLLGITVSRERAQHLLQQALDSLQPLGCEADLLRFLGRFIVERDH